MGKIKVLFLVVRNPFLLLLWRSSNPAQQSAKMDLVGSMEEIKY